METAIGASRPVVLLLFFLSGFSGLILELVWARRLSLLTGNGIQSAAAVVAFTIAGLALGSRWAGSRADRPSRPLALFALCEAGISLWAFATPALFSLVRRIVPALRWAGEGSADLGGGTFLATAALLFPGSFLMGATTPFLVRHGWSHWRRPGPSRPAGGPGGILLGSLYGWNTLGGAAGSVATVFVLLPRLGISGTTFAAGLLDLAVAATALLLPRADPDRRRASASLPDAGPSALPSAQRRIRVTCALAATGVLGGICQLVWTRLLVLFFGSSTHALGITLAACLAGLALGSAWAGRRLEEGTAPGRLAKSLLLALAAATCLALPIWGKAPALLVIAQNRLGGSFAAALALQSLLSLVLLLPAAFALGSLLPTLTFLLAGGGPRAGKDSGDGYSLDSWGSVAGSFAAAFLLLPGLGMEWTLRLAGITALLLVVLVPEAGSGPRIPRARLSLQALLCVICAACLFSLPRWDPVLMTSGPLLYASSYGRDGGGIGRVEEAMRRRGPLRFLAEGPEATVTVREGRGGILSLQINGKTDASTGPDLPTQILAGRLPDWLHSAPRRVLVIGLASGTTAGALLSESLERLDCVEISPEVARAASRFSAANGRVLEDSRVRLHIGDGRAYLQQTPLSYDLITSQPTNPWIAGVTNLFTREFFQLARARLTSGGILAVWLQGYSLDPEDFRSAVATFLQVFPQAQLWEESAAGGDYFLIGWRDGGPPDLASLRENLRTEGGVAQEVPPAGIRDAADLLSRFVAGSRGLSRFSRGGASISDDNLRLEFSAPWFLWEYRMPELISLLEENRENPLEYFPAGGSGEEEKMKSRLRELEALRSSRIRLALSLRRSDYEALSSPELSAAAGLIRSGHPEAALPLLREARRQAPDAPTLPLLEGWILLGRGEAEAAARRFQEARALDPRSGEAANGEGLAAWRAGDTRQAFSHFQAAAALAPGDPQPGNNLASLLLEQGREKEALPWLNGVLARHPRFVPGLINRGVALARLGRLEEARADYLRALELDPRNPDATYNLERLREREQGD